jgi:hypothetical protein
MKKILVALAAILVSGCVSTKSSNPRYLMPNPIEGTSFSNHPSLPHVYEQENEGVRVATMMAFGRGNLLMLSVAVMNETSRAITIDPQQIYLAINRFYLISPLTPQQVVARKVPYAGGSPLFDAAQSIPYNDPYGFRSVASSASSMFKHRGSSSELVEMVGQRSFKRITLPPGFATQGLLYYDPIGYDPQRTQLPIRVSISVDYKNFQFEFLPKKK